MCSSVVCSTFAFPLLQWLNERVIFYVHVHCLFYHSLVLSSSYRAFISINIDFIRLTYSRHGKATDRYKAASLMALMSHRALCVCVCVCARANQVIGSVWSSHIMSPQRFGRSYKHADYHMDIKYCGHMVRLP
jgi:hypothetical protein